MIGQGEGRDFGKLKNRSPGREGNECPKCCMMYEEVGG